MKSTHIKMSVSFIILCAMLLSHFALFSISSVNAQGSSPATAQIPTEQPRALTGREGAVDPVAAEAEAQRMVNEFRAAQQNEQINPPISNTQKLDQIKCGWSDWIFGDSIGCALLWVFNTLVNFIIEIPLAISAAMLNKMSEVNLDGAAFGSPFVTIGWGISRNVANMFFIFFVLWMALATIFQFESYSAKRLLPKLIIVALLVNFSLPIGLFVIRATNAIGDIFYKAAKGDTTLSEQILNMTQATVTRQSVELTKEQAAVMPGGASGMTCQESFNASAVSQFVPKLVLDHMVDYCIRRTQQRYVDSQGGILSYAYTAVFWKLIIGLVSAFVFFAGAIFLLVRYLSLVILLIFGPLAFLFMILPATQEHWNKWWNKLIQWSFFAPVFFFMIMLSTRVSTEILPAQYQLAKTAEDAQKLPMPSLAFQYILATGLFIASLMVAQSMGIAMSGTVVGWGRSMARGAGRYAKGASFRGAARMGGAYAKMALETPQARRMAATPIVRGLLRPLEAAVGAKRGVEEERAKQIAGAIRSGNPAYAAARLQGERASVQAAYLRSAGKDDIQKLERGMGAQAMGVMMNQLKSIAPELGKKIGQSFKDIDLRITAAKGVAMGTPEFERAREEYMSEQTPYALGQILTAENLQKQWVQKYLLARGGEKEINAITQTGEQIRGLASIFEQWGDAEMRNNTSLGNEIRQNIAMGQQSFGYSPEQARRETMISYLPELFEKQAQQMGIATNQALQRWAQAAPARVMLGEGRVIQRGTDMDELLRRLSGGGGTAPQSTPPGGSPTP